MAKREANIIVRLRDEATAGFKRLGGAVNAVLKPLSLATAALTGLAAAGGGLFLRSAIRTAGEFGEQMSILQGLTGAAAEELRALEDAAREAGATTRFTATEAGQGLEELIRGGQRSTEAIQSLNAALSLAAGNNQTVAESAQQMITALNAFGLEADSAGRAADVYTRVAQRSAQTTRELAEAMTHAAPIARGAGLDIEQTAALTGALADQGFRGSMAGTALRNALIELRNPAGRFRQELAELGIESTDFIEVLEELEQRGPAAEAALLALGKRSGPAIQALLQGGTGSVRNLIVELRNAGGAADEAAAAMENNLPGALRTLRSAFEDLQIEAVGELTDGLKDSVFDLAQGIRDFTKSPALASLRGLLTDTFNAGREAVQNFINGVDFDQASRSIDQFASNAAEKIRSFGEQTTVLKNGFRQTIGGIQILIGTARAAYNALGVVIGSVITASTAGMNTLLKAFDRATLGLNRWISGITSELDHLQASFAESTQGFAEGFGRSIDQIGAGWDRLAGITKEGAAQVADAAEDALGGAAETAEEYTERLKDALMGAGLTAEQVGRQVSEAAEEIGDAGQPVESAARSFDDLSESIEAASGLHQLQNLTAEVQQLGDQGELSAGQVETLTQAIQRQNEALTGSDKEVERQSQRTKDLAGNVQTLSEASDEASGRMVRLGGSIELGAAAQEKFNAALEQWKGGGTYTYIQHFKRALDGALETQQRVSAAQERLNALQQAGVPITDNLAESNRLLKYELMELRGEQEELLRLQQRESEEALQAQLALAQAQGDEEQIRLIHEQIRLRQELAREQERSDRERQLQRRSELDDARELAAEEQRIERARGGGVQRDTHMTVTFIANTDPNGITISEQERQRLINGVIDAIDRDRGRT